MRSHVAFFLVLCGLLALGQSARQPLTIRDEVSAEREARVFENEIRQFLACIQDNLNEGMPNVGLPPLNPLELDDLNINLDNTLASGKLHVKNLRLDGIAQWKFDRLKTSATIFPPGYKADLRLSNPTITLDTDYDVDVVVADKKITGNGHVSLQVDNFSLDGNLKASIASGIKDLNFVVDVDKSDLKVTGLMNDDEFSQMISDEVTNNLPTYLKENAKEISALLKKVIMGIIHKKGGKSSGNSIEIDNREISLDEILSEIKKRCKK